MSKHDSDALLAIGLIFLSIIGVAIFSLVYGVLTH